MSLEAIACAIAAADLGYPSFSEVIRDRELAPAAVADLLGRHATNKESFILVGLITAGVL
jgi:hypothetical protein